MGGTYTKRGHDELRARNAHNAKLELIKQAEELGYRLVAR